MNYINNVTTIIDNNTHWLEDKTIVTVIGAALCIYCAFFSDKTMPPSVVKVLENSIVKFALLLIIAYTSTKNVPLSIIMAISFFTIMVTSMQHSKEYMMNILSGQNITLRNKNISSTDDAIYPAMRDNCICRCDDEVCTCDCIVDYEDQANNMMVAAPQVSKGKGRVYSESEAVMQELHPSDMLQQSVGANPEPDRKYEQSRCRQPRKLYRDDVPYRDISQDININVLGDLQPIPSFDGIADDYQAVNF